SEMWRAIRLVVDTGLHAKGWTEQEAVDYFRANSSIPDAAIRSEVQRYLVYPGQATAYKVGMIRIQQLRRKAEEALGERFDIRGLHDAVLGGGAMPLDLPEQRVDRSIASQQGLGPGPAPRGAGPSRSVAPRWRRHAAGVSARRGRPRSGRRPRRRAGRRRGAASRTPAPAPPGCRSRPCRRPRRTG